MGGLENVKKWLNPDEKILFFSAAAIEGHVNKFGENSFPNQNVQGGAVFGDVAITDLRIFGTSTILFSGGRMAFEWITDPDYANSRVKSGLQYEGRALPNGKSPKDLGAIKNPFYGTNMAAIIHVASDAELVTRKSLLSTSYTIGIKVAMIMTGLAETKQKHQILSKLGSLDKRFYELHELRFNKPVMKETGSAEEKVEDHYKVVLAVIQKQLRSMTTEKINNLYDIAESE